MCPTMLSERTIRAKSPKWKQELNQKNKIDKIKGNLKQKGLIDKGLIEEREMEIKFLENEMLDFSTRQVWTKWGFDDTKQIGKSNTRSSI
jgi:hypothetical protein